MSIHLVDKTNDDRSNPTPNAHDKLVEGSQGAIGTLSTSFSQKSGNARLQMANNQIAGYDASGNQTLDITPMSFEVNASNNSAQGITITDSGISLNDGATRRFIVGPDSTGREVVKLSQTGYDAFSAPSTNLILDSTRNSFIVLDSGTTTLIPTNSGSPTYDVTGGTQYTVSVDLTALSLSDPPAARVYVQTPFSGAPLVAMPWVFNNNTTSVILNAYYTVTATALTIVLSFGGGFGFGQVPLFSFRYYIEQVSAT